MMTTIICLPLIVNERLPKIETKRANARVPAQSAMVTMNLGTTNDTLLTLVPDFLDLSKWTVWLS